MSLNAPAPIVLVKKPNNRKAKKTGGYRWCICTDGSDKSIKAFDKMVGLWREGDTCVFLHVDDGRMKVADIEKLFKPHLEKNNVIIN